MGDSDYTQDPPREWTCKNCGTTNPLFAVNCQKCHDPLTDLEAERQGLRGHEKGLPEYVRREFKDARLSEEERALKREELLRKRLYRDTGAGIMLSGCSLLLTGILAGSLVFLVLALPGGAVAGYMVNRRGGGNFTGMWIFGTNYLVCWIASVILSGANVISVPFFVFSLIGFALSLPLGYLLGMSITMERFDEGF
ncbi:MAG: zinc finger Ran-binding domain-containing protein [Planctomycetota bacterium]|jgi:hypothetical protein